MAIIGPFPPAYDSSISETQLNVKNYFYNQSIIPVYSYERRPEASRIRLNWAILPDRRPLGMA